MPLLIPRPESLLNIDRPYLLLGLLFAIWKALLLVLVLLAPGPGYDTSTTLLPPLLDGSPSSALYSTLLWRVATRLVRWDALYFTQIARRGYVFEQEWAFGWGHTQLLGLVARQIFGNEAGTIEIAAFGVVLSHLFHYGSVLILFELTRLVLRWANEVERASSGVQRWRQESTFALLVSTLHILSPAGVFLSAPYAEALFSMLNFAGMYAYVKATSYGSSLQWQFIAGLWFGLASTVRGNGLFSGTLFVADVIVALPELISLQHWSSAIRKLIFTGFSGILMAFLAIVPQWLAYRQYCILTIATERRSWCHSFPPSIYTWVQKEYWLVIPLLLGFH